jgi:hypothetical protein
MIRAKSMTYYKGDPVPSWLAEPAKPKCPHWPLTWARAVDVLYLNQDGEAGVTIWPHEHISKMDREVLSPLGWVFNGPSNIAMRLTTCINPKPRSVH